MATTAAPPPGTRPCARDKLALDGALQGVDQALGEQRIGAARLVRLDRARQHAHADQERLLAADDARAVEDVLEVVLRPRRSRRR